MKNYRVQNIGHVIVAFLNINSIRNKFDQLKILIGENVDILVIQETKINKTFPEGKFLIDGFSQPFRLDRTGSGGGILIYVRDNILSVELKHLQIQSDFEGISVELNFNNKKWLLLGTYNPSKQNLDRYLSQLNLILEQHTPIYENIIILGDFNIEESNTKMKNFMIDFGLRNLIKDKTCYKNPLNPSCIDLILTNRPRSFQNSTVIDTGLSDFHRMVLSSFKANTK